MSLKAKLSILITILPILFSIGCGKSPAATQKAQSTDALEDRMKVLEEEIDYLVGDAACTEDASCQTMAFGEKPCGGPWTYLVYSLEETDASSLETAVQDYNSTEEKYNRVADGLVSNCIFIQPPQALKCINMRCAETSPE